VRVRETMSRSKQVSESRTQNPEPKGKKGTTRNDPDERKGRRKKQEPKERRARETKEDECRVPSVEYRVSSVGCRVEEKKQPRKRI
jgi:hypothetical protein